MLDELKRYLGRERSRSRRLCGSPRCENTERERERE